jgi:hypothetical protein
MRQIKIECPKDTWVTLISDYGNGSSHEHKISFETPDGKPVSGIYEERRYFWIYPQASTIGELKNQMSFRRYWINAIYTVRVRTNADAFAYLHVPSKWVRIIVWGFIIIAVIIAILFLSVFSSLIEQ